MPPPLPFGAILRSDGVEFVFFSRHATSVSVLLYKDPQSEPTDEIILDPVRNRRGDLWYVFVPDLGAGQLYSLKVDGPNDPALGHRFDPSIVLMDPWARAFTTNAVSKSTTNLSPFRDDNAARPKCVVTSNEFDWQKVANPRRSHNDTIIYEIHVRGFTKHSNSQCQHAGTYLGIIEKIPYLKQLGVTAVELLPIHEFDDLELGRKNPQTGEVLKNYWGYSSYGFFAPTGHYAASKEIGAQVSEFKTMVRELHRAGIEVILDVVFNHTGEQDASGSTISFRGIDNSIYYFLKEDKTYRDFSGCGNSVNSNHPVVRAMILNSLRYWASHMEVDGFRFDLASVLSRDQTGNLVGQAPILDGIAEDPVLRDVKIIAEAWDAVGAYQVGSFFGGKRWSEWNGRYRDDVRQFWRGDAGKTGALATRLMGSSDLYARSGKGPLQSINFVTCHDGFTMNDLVSYTRKRNLANGENNNDGDNNNNSANYGVEGASDNPEIDAVRARQIKNFIATLMFSQGVPMILGGDEFRRTQLGNNNAYCQDNDISWFDWQLLEKNRDMFRFWQAVIAFRKQHPVFRRTKFFAGVRKAGRTCQDVEWYGLNGKTKVWELDDGTLACVLDGVSSAGMSDPEDDDMLILFNASAESKSFVIPAGEHRDRPWTLFADTGRPSPQDVYPDGNGPSISPGAVHTLIPRSMACYFRRQNI